ncbi:phospholipase D family protein [Mesorhizobium sp. M0913]|uniref:phospholipase D family protein n=1 Tax=Mesorhizobium sp. M0913 TaxID=2957026 RepID=UPI00333CE385
MAATYSASLDTILSLPAAMLVDGSGGPKRQAGIFTAADLAALKRICGRTAIFCQGAAIHPAELIPPAIIEAEEMVHEVSAPNGGSFHPKVWVMRFKHAESGRLLLRMGIMSRNLTGDASWDAGIVLNSTVAAAAPTTNDLGALLRLLPGRCHRPLDAKRRALLLELAKEVETAKWKMPAGIGAPAFHLIGGQSGRAWVQPQSERLAIISPFLTPGAIKKLTQSAKARPVLVSRPLALEHCWPAISGKFDRHMVLAPPGDVTDAPRANGVHAKILLWENRSKVRMALGSMNATSAAISGRNVEFMVSFDCTKAIGPAGIDTLLERSSLGSVLEDFEPEPGGEPLSEPFDDRPARYYLLAAQLHLACVFEECGWAISLVPKSPHADIATLLPSLRFRPATLAGARAGACAAALAAGEAARLPGTLELAEITGFTVFEADGPDGPIAFVLNLEVRGVDEGARRHAALKALLSSNRMFSDFLRTLLGDFQALDAVADTSGAEGLSIGWKPGQSGLLEMLIRCAADDPARFTSIKETLQAFGPDELEAVAPPGFLKIWSAILETAGAQP